MPRDIESAPRDGTLIVGFAGDRAFVWPIRFKGGHWIGTNDEGGEFHVHPDEWETTEEFENAD
tara:strand:- start:116 stop:304 length:189 start_codon:yes stop_codon:yes gene_type:complete